MMYTNVAEQMSHSRLVPVRRTTQSREILIRELNAVPSRILAETGGQIRLKCSEKVVDLLLAEVGRSSRSGFIKQVLERQVVRPLLRLIHTGQIVADELLSIEVEEGRKTLYFTPAQSRQSHRSQLL